MESEMKKILIVDDSATNLQLVENAMKDHFKLALAKSGEKAIKFLEKNQVDLILLDLLMPEMDGFETFEHIKKIPINANTPVVFLTADMDTENEIKGLKMGAMDFLRKPFVPEIMLNRVNHILQLLELMNELEEKVEEKTSQIEKISFATIATVASMIEAKDSYTKGHSVRVSEYSAKLAKKLGWEEEQVQNLKYIALLHDIGKVGIPDSVLNKPSKLTDIEFDIIKSHTTVGGDILADIETIKGVALGARFHHERYDGKGYPDGLAGEEIPEIARIICICDAYDAMNSNRIYRNKLNMEQIKGEISKNRGTQFDPLMVDSFLELIDEGELESNASLDIEEDEKTITTESTNLLNQIVKNIEEESKKNDRCDVLTGLLDKKNGELEISEAIKKSDGCLAFIDLDNLKKTNDIMGHLAGDYAIKSVGDVLRKYADENIACRLGGDEFVIFMPNVDSQEAKERIESIILEFSHLKEGNVNLSFSSLSIGMTMTRIDDFYADIIRKADKALYHVKQSGKSGYYMQSNSFSGANKKDCVDLNRLVTSLQDNRSYIGNLNLGYRDFTQIYDFVLKMAERFQWKLQLLMITIEQSDGGDMNVEEQENAMECMEKAINSSLRGVDVSTRFSSEQFLVVLINAGADNIDKVVVRIFDRFYKIYHNNAISISYDIAKLGEER